LGFVVSFVKKSFDGCIHIFPQHLSASFGLRYQRKIFYSTEGFSFPFLMDLFYH